MSTAYYRDLTFIASRISGVFWEAPDADLVQTFSSSPIQLTSSTSWRVCSTLKCLFSFLHLLVKSKLPNIAALGQAARTLMLSINAVVIESPPLGTVRPQFVRLPRHNEAMVQRACRSDYVRQLASSVRAQYNRMRITTTLLIVSGSVVISVIQLSATSTRSTIRIQCSIR